MPTEFKLPELGEGVDSAEVAQIYISAGDQIQANQNIMELETEKAVADLPCPHAGKVNEIHVSEGHTIEVGQTILTIEEVADDKPEEDPPADKQDDGETSKAKTGSGDNEDEDNSAEESKAQDEESKAQDEESKAEDEESKAEDEESKAEKAQQPVAEPQGDAESQAEASTASEKQEEVEATAAQQANRDGLAVANRPGGEEQHVPPAAGPATRRLARQLGVELDQFEPPKGGRITQEDVVRAYVESGRAAMLSSQSLPDFTTFGPVEREPLNKIAQTAAKRLTGSWRTVPHVTQHGLADITELETARRQYTEKTSGGRAKITLTSIAVKSVVGLLKAYPHFNSSLDYQHRELILKKHYHIGVAVDTDHGLLVPVIRDVDRKSIEQIAEELNDLADKARRRRLGKDDFAGGTFTISNQGGIGGGEFTPIVNYPEVAILGIARARNELRMVDRQPAERLILPLSLSYDHRVINGADAARFVDKLASILSDEFSLLIST